MQLMFSLTIRLAILNKISLVLKTEILYLHICQLFSL